MQPVTTSTELPLTVYIESRSSVLVNSYILYEVMYGGDMSPWFVTEYGAHALYGVAFGCSRWSRRTSEGSSSHLWVILSDGTPSSYVTGNHNSGAFYTLGVAMFVLFLSVEEFP